MTGDADRDGLAPQSDHDFLPSSDPTPASFLQVGESFDVMDLDRDPGRTAYLTLLGVNPLDEVDRLGEDLGTSLKLSHLLRACMTLLCHAEGELHNTAATLAPLIRPANGDAIALAQFEYDLAKLLSKALRDAPPVR